MKEEIDRFIEDFPNDDTFLAKKVSLIIGIHGCCRRCELVAIKRCDVKKVGNYYFITIMRRKQKVGIRKQEFLITEPLYVGIVDCYVNLFDAKTSLIREDPFFRKVQKGKLTKQVVGRNKIGSYPKEIAVTLGLHNSVKYTAIVTVVPVPL
jgi:hypothetical protein